MGEAGAEADGRLPFDAAARRRLVSRACVAFLLDVIAIARSGRHPIDAMLLSVIVQANVAPVAGRADLQVSFAGADTPPSDEMRRPISINALAASLRLPFETVRRRVHGLRAEGLCRVSAAGVMVPTSLLTSPEYLAPAFAAYERLRALHALLRDMDALGELPWPTVGLDSGFVPVRAVARAASDYVLRAFAVAQAEFGDVISCLLLLETVRANTEHLGFDQEPPEMLGPGGFLLDAHRWPVRIATLARRIGVPEETTRRYLLPMVERGWLVRRTDGLIAPAAMLASPRVRRFGDENQLHLRRMFATLSQLGVLAIWDTLDAPVATAPARSRAS